MTTPASGKWHGRAGTFVLQHTGTMNRGAPQLSVTVIFLLFSAKLAAAK
jgi:hypothetical protein